MLILLILTWKKSCTCSKPKRKKTNISESSAFCSGKFSKGKIIKHSTKRNLELIVVNNMLEPDIWMLNLQLFDEMSGAFQSYTAQV